MYNRLVIFIVAFTLVLSHIDVIAQAKPNFIPPNNKLFPVKIVHINDFHARFEETNEKSTRCLDGEKCIGGYARLVTIVRDLMSEQEKNPIYLNAGDNFQGTFWYTIGRWNVTNHFLNLLPADAMTLGNHEFDNGIDGIVPFLDRVQSPVIVSNIDSTNEPTFNGKYQKSVVIDRYDRKIGLIGAILSTTNEISKTGKLIFTNETIAIREEAKRLKEQGVNIIIVLSHCGLQNDKNIARAVGPDVDVIVGGHSHSYLSSDPHHAGPDTPQDEYPSIVTQTSGHRVLIVQAGSYAKYVGDLTVYFDKNGIVQYWEGQPIFLDTDIAQDQQVVEEMEQWRKVIEDEGASIVGISRVSLARDDCYYGECNLGNMLTDAYVNYYAMNETAENGNWTPAAIAIQNAAGIRSSLPTGVIAYSDVVTTIPFENTIDLIELKGKYLLQAIEHGLSKSYKDNLFVGPYLLQVSGLRILSNFKNPPTKRVTSIEVLSRIDDHPVYEPLNVDKIYPVIVPSFFVDGGDGFTMISNNMQNHRIGPVDIDIVTDFIRHKKVLTSSTNRRLVIHQ